MCAHVTSNPPVKSGVVVSRVQVNDLTVLHHKLASGVPVRCSTPCCFLEATTILLISSKAHFLASIIKEIKAPSTRGVPIFCSGAFLFSFPLSLFTAKRKNSVQDKDSSRTMKNCFINGRFSRSRVR